MKLSFINASGLTSFLCKCTLHLWHTGIRQSGHNNFCERQSDRLHSWSSGQQSKGSQVKVSPSQICSSVSATLLSTWSWGQKVVHSGCSVKVHSSMDAFCKSCSEAFPYCAKRVNQIDNSVPGICSYYNFSVEIVMAMWETMFPTWTECHCCFLLCPI